MKFVWNGTPTIFGNRDICHLPVESLRNFSIYLNYMVMQITIMLDLLLYYAYQYYYSFVSIVYIQAIIYSTMHIHIYSGTSLKDPLAKGHCIKYLLTGDMQYFIQFLMWSIITVPPNKDNPSIKDKCLEYLYWTVPKCPYSEVPLYILAAINM